MDSLQINNAQLEVLNVMSCIKDDEDLTELKSLLVRYLNDRLQSKLDKMWEDGQLTEDKFDNLRKEHLRTPYKQ